MQSYTFPRAGKRPLAFTGTLVVETTGHRDNGPCNARWWEIAVYQTESGQFVLIMSWHTNWQNETGWDYAAAFKTADDLAAELEAFDPLSKLVGFPISNDQKYAKRQKFIEDAIIAEWDRQVSTIMEEIALFEFVP